MDLGRLIRERVRRALEAAATDDDGDATATSSGRVNIASTTNVDGTGHTTSVYSDGEVTVVTRDGKTEVIRHREHEGDDPG